MKAFSPLLLISQTLLIASASFCALQATSALAQTPAPSSTKPAPKPVAKPAAKPPAPAAAPAPTAAPAAAEQKTGSLGAGTSGGPLLTREELRACFSQERSIRDRLNTLEAERAELEKGKQAIGADQQALRVERGPLDKIKEQADDLGTRLRAFATRVEVWNQRVVTHNTSKRSAAETEKSRLALNAEREAIEKDRAGLEGERTALTSNSETALKAYNARASEVDVRVSIWNERNVKSNEVGSLLESDRKTWVTNCADRRYREDDEKAIQAGK